MSSKFKDSFLFVFITVFFSVLLLIVPFYNLKSSKSYFETNNKETISMNDKNIEAVIKQVSANKEIISKFKFDDNYTNVFLRSFDDNGKYIFESHLYQNNTGLEVTIKDLIIEDKLDDFWDKIYELLAYKYPYFIVDGIKNSEGINAYDIKENEMVIYFLNYTINPAIEEVISLKVNYNEIKEFINYTYRLDDIYINENGFDYKIDKPTIALTFDDGPSGNKTEKILELLNKNKAHASFFMVGNKIVHDQSTVKKVYDSGNEIGSHTYAHENLTRQTKSERIDALSLTDEVYKQITGDTINLLRPPYGAYKRDMLDELDYSVILWNIDTEDWRYKNVDKIIDTVLTNLTDGSIILMHDTYNTTVEAVEKLLPILYAKGYQVVSVSELAKMKGVELEKNTAYRKFK